MDYIKNFDFFSTKAKFTFNKKGETRMKTVIGGIISLISISCSIAFSLYFFVSFITKTNKSLISSTNHSDRINITDSNNLPFLFRFSDVENRPYSNPEQIYKIQLKFWYGGSDNNSEITQQYTNNINVEKCDINKHFGIYKSVFEHYTDLDTFYCVIPRLQNQSIYGIYGNTEPFGFYHVYFYMCVNKEKDDNCIEMNDIRHVLSNTYLDMRSVNYMIDSQNVKDVKIPIVKVDRHMVSMTVYKRIWIYLSSVEYITDDGLVFSKKSNNTFHQVDSYRYDVDMRKIEDATISYTFLTVTILSNGQIKIYNRSFVKIQEYIATIGGILKCISTGCFFINYLISLNSYYINIMNDPFIMKYEITPKNSQLNLPTQQKKNPIIAKTTNVRVSNRRKNELYIIPENIEKKPNLKQKNRSKKINIKCYQLLCPIKILLMSHSYSRRYLMINQLLSIFEYLRCVQEHKLIKSQLMQNRQNNMNINSKDSNCIIYSVFNQNIADFSNSKYIDNSIFNEKKENAIIKYE